MIHMAQAANFMLRDRCGAQGLFEMNQLSSMHVWSFHLDAFLYTGFSLSIIVFFSLTCIALLLPRVTC